MAVKAKIVTVIEMGVDCGAKGKVQPKNIESLYEAQGKLMRDNLKVTIELVTPETAQKYLSTTIKNRKPIKSAVEQFAHSIEVGNWGVNPQPIVFDNNGHMMDGQHRMLAIVQSGIAIYLLVVRGVPASSFDVIDGGGPRSLAQVMHIDGISMFKAKASIVRTVVVYERAMYTSLKFAGGVNNREGLAFYRNHPQEIDRAAEWGTKVYKGKHGTTAGGGFVAYVLFAIAPEKAAKFLEGIATGANLPPDSPILNYRNQYATLRAQGSVHRNTQVDMMFEAWNKWNGHKTERTKMVIPYGLDITAPTISNNPSTKF